MGLGSKVLGPGDRTDDWAQRKQQTKMGTLTYTHTHTHTVEMTEKNGSDIDLNRSKRKY